MITAAVPAPVAERVAADVTVVLCAYTLDRWPSIVAGVRSLALQTLLPRQVVLVVDHNPELLVRARAHLPEMVPGLVLHVVESENPPGLSGARNTGVALSDGSVIAFLDDDAVADPAWVARLTAPYADALVMGTGGLCVPDWEAGRPWWFPREFDWVVGCSYRGLPEEEAEIRNPIGAGMSLRRSALARAGAFREDVGRVGVIPRGCEETEMAVRIRQRIRGACIVHVPSAVVSHAVPPERGRLRYFLSRCHAEGLSKAQVVRLVGREAGLGSERDYVWRTLPSGVRDHALDALRGDRPALGRAGMIPVGLIATGIGYLRGVTRLRRSGTVG